jgi:predicted DNA-binding protein (UPF0251 family)
MEGCPRRRRWRRSVWRKEATTGSGNLEEIFFIPTSAPASIFRPEEVVELYPEELLALKLVYAEDLEVDEAAARLGLSKATFWRMLDSGRKKMVTAILQLRPIKIVFSEKASMEKTE